MKNKLDESCCEGIEKVDRVAIFSFYEQNGCLTKSVEHTLVDLRKVVDYLIVVVNGSLREPNRMAQLVDEVIVRENKGYDAGAYKRILMNERIYQIIKQCEELVLCNDTFYGPFISFDEIFQRMKDSKADFWGINLSDNGWLSFIQSYFIVFKKKIIFPSMKRKREQKQIFK